jgi:hypothetical protein
MVDDYLIQQAAKKEKLSVADYVKREVDDKVVAKVDDATAKKFYDDNKDKIPALKTAGSYDKIKDRLIAALRQRAAQEEHEQLLARLRKDGGAKIMLEAPRLNVNVGAASHPTLGPKNAPVTMIEFADFQCPYCKRSEDAVKAVHDKYGDRVRLVFMDFPLSFHPHAMPAAPGHRTSSGHLMTCCLPINPSSSPTILRRPPKSSGSTWQSSTPASTRASMIRRSKKTWKKATSSTLVGPRLFLLMGGRSLGPSRRRTSKL